MEPILFMVHRIPYPPNKGDKIRSFNMLRWLSERYDVHLGCFLDSQEDKEYVAELAVFCKSYKVIELTPPVAKIKSLRAFLTGGPITLPYFWSIELAEWVANTVREQDIRKAFMFSSPMAQYLEPSAFEGILRVIDFIDVDSDKWKQYAEKASFPMSWVYQRECRTLAKYEEKIADMFDSVALVSSKEAELFRTIIRSELHSKVHSVSNGVDSDYFSLTAKFDLMPFSGQVVSFTGAMDYWANVEAVVWFCKKVWPLVLERTPKACFYIVGTSPSSEVLALHDGVSVVVTGRVKDVRPYLNASAAVVAPLRIARGIQNKVLEALSMERYVIGTTMAFEGIECDGKDLDISIVDDEVGFSEALSAQLEIEAGRTSIRAHMKNRKFVTDYYNWEAKLNELTPLLLGKEHSPQTPETEKGVL